MARDLAPEVEKLIRGNNSYLRKKVRRDCFCCCRVCMDWITKADLSLDLGVGKKHKTQSALALIRMLHKEPDLLEHMAEKVVGLLKDRSHGVLNSALQLIIEILIMDPSQAQTYSRLVPSLVRLLKNLISMGYSPEHDVAGITDPFLQVRLLRLLGLLGKGNDEASEAMNDVLAQVATSTESAKNAGNAVLYECVKTILTIQSDASLRGLAVNILGRFLLNRENSIRYVALHMLAEVVHQDAAAVQRHRTTIVECLKDSDISIRVRAMELIFQLVNEQNASILTPELLNYLTTAPAEQKGLLASRIMEVTEKFSPTKQWRIDTLVQLLTLAGNHCDDRVPRLTIVFITQSEGLHAYAVHKLYRAFLKDTSQIGLVNVAIWCIGEYGELLLRPCPDGSDGTFDAVSDSDVVASLERVTRLHNADATTKGLLINSLMKLTTRFSAASQAPIQNIIAAHRSSMILELQQRAVEYCSILASQPEQLRRETLSKMPVLDEATMRRKHAEFAALTDESPSSAQKTPSSAGIGGLGALPALQTNAGGDLLDLDDIFGGAPAPQPAVVAAAPISPVAALGANGDLLGHAPVVSPTPAASTPSAAIDLLDIFSTPATPSTPALTPLSGAPVLSPVADFGAFAAAPAPQAEPTFTAFEKAGFQVVFKCSKPEPGNPSATNVDVVFRNTSAREVNQLLFQAAVPKVSKAVC